MDAAVWQLKRVFEQWEKNIELSFLDTNMYWALWCHGYDTILGVSMVVLSSTTKEETVQ